MSAYQSNNPDIPTPGRVLVSAEDLAKRVTVLGREITADYAGRSPLLVGVLKGAFMFMSDLARAIDLPVELDFMAVSSYGHSTRSSGVVRIVKDLDLDLADRPGEGPAGEGDLLVVDEDLSVCGNPQVGDVPAELDLFDLLRPWKHDPGNAVAYKHRRYHEEDQEQECNIRH